MQGHRDRVNARNRAYRASHPGFAARDRERARQWREANPDQFRARRDLWHARRRAEEWRDRGIDYADYADYLARGSFKVPMSEVNFGRTLRALRDLQADRAVAVVYRDGCVEGVPSLASASHPYGNRAAYDRGRIVPYRNVLWVPEIQLLAGIVRSVMADPCERFQVEGDVAYRDALEWLVDRGLLERGRYGVRVTGDGRRLVAACGGRWPKGAGFDVAALPEQFRLASGVCPRTRPFPDPHRSEERE